MKNAGWLAMALALVAGHGAMAEVFKCLDESGQTSYQDTSCQRGQAQTQIDTRYTSTLPLVIPREDARAMAAIRAADARNAKARVRQRNARIRQTLNQRDARQAQCDALTARHEAMVIRARRYGRADPDAEAHLVYRMREACSG